MNNFPAPELSKGKRLLRMIYLEDDGTRRVKDFPLTNLALLKEMDLDLDATRLEEAVIYAHHPKWQYAIHVPEEGVREDIALPFTGGTYVQDAHFKKKLLEYQKPFLRRTSTKASSQSSTLPSSLPEPRTRKPRKKKKEISIGARLAIRIRFPVFDGERFYVPDANSGTHYTSVEYSLHEVKIVDRIDLKVGACIGADGAVKTKDRPLEEVVAHARSIGADIAARGTDRTNFLKGYHFFRISDGANRESYKSYLAENFAKKKDEGR